MHNRSGMCILCISHFPAQSRNIFETKFLQRMYVVKRCLTGAKLFSENFLLIL